MIFLGFLLPFAPEAIPGAIALCTGVCTLVTRVGVQYGPRIVELIDVLFADGIATSGIARAEAVRLAPAVAERLAKQFHDLPNARVTISIAHNLVQHALVHGKLYGKEIKAIVDATLHHKFVPSKVVEALRAAASGKLKVAHSVKPVPGHVVHEVKPGTGIAQTNRHAANMAWLKEQHRARQGARTGSTGLGI